MRHRIRQVVASSLGIPLERLSEDASNENTEKWDSLGHIGLMLAIELEFNVRMTAEDMLRLTSIDKIADYLGDESEQSAGD